MLSFIIDTITFIIERIRIIIDQWKAIQVDNFAINYNRGGNRVVIGDFQHHCNDCQRPSVSFRWLDAFVNAAWSTRDECVTVPLTARGKIKKKTHTHAQQNEFRSFFPVQHIFHFHTLTFSPELYFLKPLIIQYQFIQS